MHPRIRVPQPVCGLTPRSSGAPTACHAGPQALGLRPILRLLSSAPCRCHPLSSNVRPRMPTLAASPPLFGTQRRAQRGRSAFVACAQLLILNRGLGQKRISLPLPPRFAACRAGRPREASSLMVAGHSYFLPRPSSLPSSYFSISCAAATDLRTVQGLTPRSSGAPTAPHQARSVVQEHSPQPGPGVLPLSPA